MSGIGKRALLLVLYLRVYSNVMRANEKEKYRRANYKLLRMEKQSIEVDFYRTYNSVRSVKHRLIFYTSQNNSCYRVVSIIPK